MALTQVRAQVDGVWYTLTYDAAQRCYVAEIPTGDTSADQPGGYFDVTVEATSDTGATASLDGGDIPGLRLVVKDLTAPTVTLVSPPQGYVTTRTPEIVADLTDDSSGIDISTLAVTIDGAPESSVTTAANTGGYRATITPTLADGLHTVEISVTDNDGNTGTLALLYTVDTTPPVLAVWDHRLVVDDPEVLIRGMASDAAGAAVTVSAGDWSTDTAPASDGSWSVSVPLSVGLNTIAVTATDGAGLTSTWTGTVVRMITDRVQADLDAVRAILARLNAETGCAADLAAINSHTQRGAYNDTDLNRVIAAADLVYQSLVDQGLVVDYVPMDPEFPQDGQLPEGYTELEYIESTGTQYIDTGVKPNQDTRVAMDIELLSQETINTGILGVRDTVSANAENKFIAWSMNTGATIRSDYFSTAANVTSLTSIVGQRMVIDKDKNVCSFGETVLTNVAATGQCTMNLFLLAVNDGVNGASYFGKFCLYSCKIYDNGTLIRDFVPAKNSGEVVGLYELVNHVFYGNAGAGAFTAGPEVPAPPPVAGGPWAEGDIPTQSQLQTYLQNVVNLFQARLVQAQYITIPASMASLTLAGANNIEWALVCVDAVTPVARKSYIYSGEAMAGEF